MTTTPTGRSARHHRQAPAAWRRRGAALIGLCALLLLPAPARSEPAATDNPDTAKVKLKATAQWIPYVNRNGVEVADKKTLEVIVRSPTYRNRDCDISISFHKTAKKTEHAKQLILSHTGYCRTYFGPYPFARVANGLWYVNLKIIDRNGRVLDERRLNAVRGSLLERELQFKKERQAIDLLLTGLDEVVKSTMTSYETRRKKKNPATREKDWDPESAWYKRNTQLRSAQLKALNSLAGLNRAGFLSTGSSIGEQFPGTKRRLYELRNLVQALINNSWNDLVWLSERKVFEKKLELQLWHGEGTDDPWSAEQITTMANQLVVDYAALTRKIYVRYQNRFAVLREQLNREAEVSVGLLYATTARLFVLHAAVEDEYTNALKTFRKEQAQDFPGGWHKRIGSIRHTLEKYKQEKDNGYAVEIKGFDEAITGAVTAVEALRNAFLNQLYEKYKIAPEQREKIEADNPPAIEALRNAFYDHSETLATLFQKERDARKSGFVIAQRKFADLFEQIVERLNSKKVRFIFREATREEAWLGKWNKQFDAAGAAITSAEDMEDVEHFHPTIGPTLRRIRDHLAAIRDLALKLYSRPRAEPGELEPPEIDKNEIARKIESHQKAFEKGIRELERAYEHPVFPTRKKRPPKPQDNNKPR